LKIDNIEEYVNNILERHEKIYGFGHGAYGKNGDPRTTIMKELARKLTNENKEFKTIEKVDER
jgi:citrate synthase